MLDYIGTGKYDVIFHQAAVPRVSYSVEQPGITTNINILKTDYLDIMLRDIKDIMKYKKSSQFINATLKETENPRIISP